MGQFEDLCIPWTLTRFVGVLKWISANHNDGLNSSLKQAWYRYWGQFLKYRKKMTHACKMKSWLQVKDMKFIFVTGNRMCFIILHHEWSRIVHKQLANFRILIALHNLPFKTVPKENFYFLISYLHAWAMNKSGDRAKFDPAIIGCWLMEMFFDNKQNLRGRDLLVLRWNKKLVPRV